MDKLTALKTAMDEILDADQVHRTDDGSYELITSDGRLLYVRRTDQLHDTGDWTVYNKDRRQIPNAPLHTRPHEVVAWALLG
jgi:hypothetical protein